MLVSLIFAIAERRHLLWVPVAANVVLALAKIIGQLRDNHPGTSAVQIWNGRSEQALCVCVSIGETVIQKRLRKYGR